MRRGAPNVPNAKYKHAPKAGKQLGFALRRRSDLTMPPCKPRDGSLRAEIAFALLTQRHIFRQGDSARTLNDAMMLNKKDEGRPGFRVPTRHPSKCEIDDEVACRYIFDRGKMKGMILLLVRSVHGPQCAGTLRRGDAKH